MIVSKTKLLKMPSSCKECNLKTTRSEDWGHRDFSPTTRCNLMGQILNSVKRDTKHKLCPLVEYDFDTVLSAYDDIENDNLQDLILALRTYLGE